MSISSLYDSTFMRNLKVIKFIETESIRVVARDLGEEMGVAVSSLVFRFAR